MNRKNSPAVNSDKKCYKIKEMNKDLVVTFSKSIIIGYHTTPYHLTA